jgi:hypothetical protein
MKKKSCFRSDRVQLLCVAHQPSNQRRSNMNAGKVLRDANFLPFMSCDGGGFAMVRVAADGRAVLAGNGSGGTTPYGADVYPSHHDLCNDTNRSAFPQTFAEPAALLEALDAAGLK